MRGRQGHEGACNLPGLLILRREVDLRVRQHSGHVARHLRLRLRGQGEERSEAGRAVNWAGRSGR